MTDSAFDRKIELWRMMASAAVAEKRAKAAPAAPGVVPRTTPTEARARKPVRFGLDPIDIEIPAVEDFIDPETLSAKVIRAGQMSRGEIPIPAPAMTGMAAAIHNAAETARSGGAPRPEPTGTAAAILAAGKKRRNEA